MAGLDVSCDGVVIETDSGNAIPLEPGPHVVRASAPGRAPFETTLTMVAGGSEAILVPSLAAVEARAPKPIGEVPGLPILRPAPKPHASVPSTQPVQPWRGPLSISVLTAGVASLSVGIISGARALSDAKGVERLCQNHRCTTDEGWSEAPRLDDRARVEARVADIALPLGAVAVAAAACLLWLKPASRRDAQTDDSGLQVAASASPHELGTSLRGTW